MANITKPVVLDETAQTTNLKLDNIAAAIVSGQLAPVTVTGTTATIVAEAGKRYICGELTELTFTPPAEGITDIIFTSGTTATVFNPLPQNGVIMPDGFVVEANKKYEFNFLDRMGVVQSWTI